MKTMMFLLMMISAELAAGFVGVGIPSRLSHRHLMQTSGELDVDMSGKVTVFSTKGCPYCVRAKKDLDKLEISYSVVDVQDSREALAVLSGQTSVPQIFIDGDRVGGADDLRSAIADGSFLESVERLGLSRQHQSPHQTNFGEEYVVPRGRALNDLDQLDLAATLQERALELVDEHVSETGVDYEGMKRSKSFRDFVSAASALRQLDRLDTLDDAFYINLYNAMVLHANVALGPPTTPEERKNFFSRDAKYLVGPIELTLDDIEHGILRRSKDAWRALDEDEKRIVGLDSKPPFDNRIHFALNCGAKSCPPIKLFRAESLDRDLGLAARAFLEAETEVDDDAVRLSKLLDWYGDDFGGEENLIDSILSLLPADSNLAKELESGEKKKRRIEFKDYDWTTY